MANICANERKDRNGPFPDTYKHQIIILSTQKYINKHTETQGQTAGKSIHTLNANKSTLVMPLLYYTSRGKQKRHDAPIPSIWDDEGILWQNAKRGGGEMARDRLQARARQAQLRTSRVSGNQATWQAPRTRTQPVMTVGFSYPTWLIDSVSWDEFRWTYGDYTLLNASAEDEFRISGKKTSVFCSQKKDKCDRTGENAPRRPQRCTKDRQNYLEPKSSGSWDPYYY